MDPAPDWQHRAMWMGDNLGIMRGMNSEPIDLLYLDPPVNSNYSYTTLTGSLYLLRLHRQPLPQDSNGGDVREGRITAP